MHVASDLESAVFSKKRLTPTNHRPTFFSKQPLTRLANGLKAVLSALSPLARGEGCDLLHAFSPAGGEGGPTQEDRMRGGVDYFHPLVVPAALAWVTPW